MVDAEPDLTWIHPEDLVADAHAQLVRAERGPLLGEPDSLEDDAHAQRVRGGAGSANWRSQCGNTMTRILKAQSRRP